MAELDLDRLRIEWETFDYPTPLTNDDFRQLLRIAEAAQHVYSNFEQILRGNSSADDACNMLHDALMGLEPESS